MGKEEKTNDENKKELLVLAYDTWWKLRAIKNMANLKGKSMSEVYFDEDGDKNEFANVISSLGKSGIDIGHV
jgi:hypothetical protein